MAPRGSLLVSCPDSTPKRRRGTASEFLVVLSQHAYGNFVMQSDSHVTAVAFIPVEQRSLCIRLQRRSCFLFYSSVSTVCVERRLPAAYWASSRRYGYSASELPSCSLCLAVLATSGEPETRHNPFLRRERRRLPVLQILRSTVHYICKSPCFSNLAKAV